MKILMLLRSLLLLLLLLSVTQLAGAELHRTAFIFYAAPTWGTNISFNVRRFDSGNITNQLGYTLITNVPLSSPYKCIVEFPVDPNALYCISLTNRLTGEEFTGGISPINRVAQKQ